MTLDRIGRAIERTGIGNGRGHVSFNKCVTLGALIVWAISVLYKFDPPIALLAFGVVVIGAGFGLKGYIAGKDALRLHATHTATMNTQLSGNLAEIAKVVLERRDAAKGVEPTP